MRLSRVLIVLVVSCTLFLGQYSAQADETTDAIQAQIDALRNEIEQLQIQLRNTTEQKQTLQSAIKALELQIQTLTKSISLTNTQINQKDKEIKTLSGTISDTSLRIARSEAGIAETLRTLDAQSRHPLMSSFLGGGTLSDFFDELVSLGTLRNELVVQVEDLSAMRSSLVTTKTSTEHKRTELAGLQRNLSQQKQGLNVAKADQNKLLTETKNRESNYQALIAEKEALEAKFEQDLLNYESSLGLSVAAGSIPTPRAGTLQWPLALVRITQFFGNTSFATQNPQIYGGKGHNAIDMAASNGTAVKAALGGVVLGTGDTDATCKNASYGKWVFVRHGNGLSTLYAHLSTIAVSKGQEVDVGELLGYSGNTGYSTGPHLHFGVYASSGSQITTFPSQSCRGKSYTIPVADKSAYLNPLSYLPAR